MLCNKIEIQIRVYKSKNIKIRTFRANKNGIHIFVVLSDSYIQKKKTSDNSVTQIYTEFRNFK